MQIAQLAGDHHGGDQLKTPEILQGFDKRPSRPVLEQHLHVVFKPLDLGHGAEVE